MNLQSKYYIKPDPSYGVSGSWCVYEKRRWWFDKKLAHYSLYAYNNDEAYRKATTSLQYLRDHE